MTTSEALDKMADGLLAIMAKALKERLTPLEQRIKEQDARILELEAQAAARSKVDV